MTSNSGWGHPQASLSELPSEILEPIVSYLADSGSPSINSLLHMCKRLYRIALPFSVRTYYSYPEPDDPEKGPRSRNRTLQFLRYVTIIKPELVSNVKALSLHHWSSERRESDNSMKIMADEWPLYKRLIHQTYPSENQQDSRARSEWFAALEDGVEDASIALLLVVCTSVETMLYPEPEEPGFFSGVLKTAIMANSPNATKPSKDLLVNLRSVKHLPGKNGLYLGINEVQAWPLLIPNVKVYLCVRMTLSESCSDTVDRLPRRSSSIDGVVMIDSICRPAALRSIADFCHNLRAFEYTRNPISLSDDDMTPRDIITALLPRAETLERLVIDSIIPWFKIEVYPTPDWTYIGVELRQMVKLQYLVLVIEVLTGLDNPNVEHPVNIFQTPPPPPFSECLPEQLKHLEIRSCTKDDLPRLAELAEILRNNSRFPELESVQFAFIDSGVSEAELESLHVERPGLTFKAKRSSSVFYTCRGGHRMLRVRTSS
ncbi:hypothetical protein ACHAQK_006889 [Fusarium lateritium]